MGRTRLASGLGPDALVALASLLAGILLLAGMLVLAGTSAALAIERDGVNDRARTGDLVGPQRVVWGSPARSVTELPLLVEPDDAAGLDAVFARRGFLISAVREGVLSVPRLYVSRLPNDLQKLRATERRKQLFLRTVLPLVLLANEELRSRRGRLLALRERRSAGADLEVQDRAWLDAMAELYKADPGDLDDLLARVDEIPVSLALAQAILESGWGTSRFAVKGNALFGEKTWSSGAEHLVQQNGSRTKFRAFPDLMASVRAYMHNLNSNPAYSGFRAVRAEQRANGVAPSGKLLLPALTSYAELPEYLPLVRSLIRSNRLEELEKARLDTDWFAGNPLNF